MRPILLFYGALTTFVIAVWAYLIVVIMHHVC
jgi:hypothetical protein